jgi:head-tail adaptor
MGWPEDVEGIHQAVTRLREGLRATWRAEETRRSVAVVLTPDLEGQRQELEAHVHALGRFLGEPAP